ncbi:MAG: alanine racemase [Firmicutes bacterium]|nr:alanine racemase [Alicyclobacillaceae bacterium]MCL6497474.1 alanine racemase [Bacillota bacterium]
MDKTAGRPTWAEVNLGAIRHNVRRYVSALSPGTALMAVVKADGYGHGAVPVARAALEAGATWLGVALAEEGAALREAGITAPILVLGQSYGQQIAWAVEYGLEVTVFDRETLAEVGEAAVARGRLVGVHLKIDTGMGRVGVPWERFDAEWVQALGSTSGVVWRGVMTHFADADHPDPGYTRLQFARFLDAIESLRRRQALPPWLHCANSAAALRFPGTHLSMVRVGLGLYGLKPYPAADGLVPALRWLSRVVFLKQVGEGFSVGYGRTYHTPSPMQLATVPVGYADGYRRAWSNRAHVLIRGRRYPVVGRVSMDQITVAVPVGDPVAVGDPVTLLGEDEGAVITAEELAEAAQTIAYEVVTGLSARVPRVWCG